MAPAEPTRRAVRDREEGFLASVERVCGPEVADKIGEAFGGGEVYVAADPGPGNPLRRVVGEETAKRIAREIGAGHFQSVRIGERSAHKRRLREKERLILTGLSAAKIARRTGCTTRSVFMVKASLRKRGKLP